MRVAGPARPDERHQTDHEHGWHGDGGRDARLL